MTSSLQLLNKHSVSKLLTMDQRCSESRLKVNRARSASKWGFGGIAPSGVRGRAPGNTAAELGCEHSLCCNVVDTAFCIERISSWSTDRLKKLCIAITPIISGFDIAMLNSVPCVHISVSVNVPLF